MYSRGRWVHDKNVRHIVSRTAMMPPGVLLSSIPYSDCVFELLCWLLTQCVFYTWCTRCFLGHCEKKLAWCKSKLNGRHMLLVYQHDSGHSRPTHTGDADVTIIAAKKGRQLQRHTPYSRSREAPHIGCFILLEQSRHDWCCLCLRCWQIN